MSSKSEKTREKILQASWKLLEENPRKLVRMADIAREVGISRQALYLHFPKRAELLVATTRYLDEVYKVNELFAAVISEPEGKSKLLLFLDTWCNYIPKIHGVAKALIAMQGEEEDAFVAWKDRMDALREGCFNVVKLLEEQQILNDKFKVEEARDLLWSITSVSQWENLRVYCGWSQEQYLERVREMALATLMNQ